MFSPIKEFEENKNTIYLVLIATFIFGFLAHAHSYLNVFFNHDSLYLIHNREYEFLEKHARFAVKYYTSITGSLFVPFLHGVLSLFYISISSYMIIKLLTLEDVFSQISTCAIIATSPILTISNAQYIFFSDLYMFSLLLSIAAVYISRVSNILYSIPLLVFSLGLYQSYIQVATVFILILLIKDILNNVPTKKILLYSIKSICMLCLSMIIYYIIIKYLNSQELSSYRSYNSLGDYSDVSVMSLISGSIYHPLDNLFFDPISFSNKLFDTKNMLIFVNIFLTITISTAFMIMLYVQKISKINIFLFMLIGACIPFSAGFMYFLAKGYPGVLTYFAVYLFFILSLFCLSKYKKVILNKLDINKFYIRFYGILKYTVVLTMFITIHSNVVYSNQSYVYKDIVYDGTLSLMTRIADRMEQFPNYIPGKTKVYFIGKHSYNSEYFADDKKELFNPRNFLNDDVITYYSTYKYYFKYILNIKIALLQRNKVETFAERADVLSMPLFPHKDSMKLIDGVLIIKISEEKER